MFKSILTITSMAVLAFTASVAIAGPPPPLNYGGGSGQPGQPGHLTEGLGDGSGGNVGVGCEKCSGGTCVNASSGYIECDDSLYGSCSVNKTLTC